jgi:predicted ATPase
MSKMNDPFDLLNETEKACLWRLSVFANGWTREAALAVSAEEGMEEQQVVALLRSLVEKNVVIYEEREVAEGLLIHEECYRLEETLRLDAHSRLIASGNIQGVRQRYQDYFLTLAEEAQSGIQGEETFEASLWVSRLDREHDNFLAVLEGYRSEPESGAAMLRLAAALSKFWYMRGYFWEGRQQCRAETKRIRHGGGLCLRERGLIGPLL